MWKAWAHPLWPGGEVWFRHYCCHSQVWRGLVCVYKNWLRKFTPMQSTRCFLCRAEVFFGLLSARLALGQLLSVSAGGFRDSEERRVCWKRGRGPAGARQTHQVLSSTLTVLQHSKKKGFPYSLSCSFCSACGGRNVGGKYALFTMHCSARRLSILF